VLDFAGNVARHGPITAIRLPKRAGEGGGVAPSKICPECDEIIAAQVKKCPLCGYEFPPNEKEYRLHNDDIMGRDMVKEFPVSGWGWEIQTSKKSQKEMIVCSYYCKDISQDPIREYFCVFHDGYAGYKALAKLKALCKESGIDEIPEDIAVLKNAPAPDALKYRVNGNFKEIISREWSEVPF
jgi:DNA repair protein RadD